jgi:hypothetical protein
MAMSSYKFVSFSRFDVQSGGARHGIKHNGC